ncbi:unnamed protein product [Gordionus sp. m RMFG-2023]
MAAPPNEARYRLRNRMQNLKESIAQYAALVEIAHNCGSKESRDLFISTQSMSGGRKFTDHKKEYLLSAAPAKPWTYNSRFVTDQVPEDIVYDAIKQELLQEFKFQIPYILDIKLDEYFVDEFGLFRIKASIKCPKQNLIVK